MRLPRRPAAERGRRGPPEAMVSQAAGRPVDQGAGDVAVREGFEPSMPFDIHTFQACSFGHSDTSPFPAPGRAAPDAHCSPRGAPTQD